MAFPIFSSRRLRATPFTPRLEASGLSAYTVYNHMLLPACFVGLADDYRHLKTAVQIWDVSAQRQIEIKGRDARTLAVLMSTRDLRHAVPKKGYYTAITNQQGGMLNDPIALCIAPDRFWFSIADADLLLWASGLATGLGLEVDISELDIYPLAVQGPRSESLMVKLFGAGVTELGFFAFDYFDWKSETLMIARSGWSKQGGFEIYVSDQNLALPLWDALMEAGQEFDVRAGCPNLIERIEGGLLSYGNDMTTADTPLECGLGRFCNLDSGHEFIGKSALLAQRDQGLQRKLMGLHIEGAPLTTPLTSPLPCYTQGGYAQGGYAQGGYAQGGYAQNAQGASCGFVTSAIFSPDFSRNLAIAMLNIDHAFDGCLLDIGFGSDRRAAQVKNLPFQ